MHSCGAYSCINCNENKTSLKYRHAPGSNRHYITNVIDYATYSITNKQNHNVINYDYTESNHDYICLETSSEGKQN